MKIAWFGHHPFIGMVKKILIITIINAYQQDLYPQYAGSHIAFGWVLHWGIVDYWADGPF